MAAKGPIPNAVKGQATHGNRTKAEQSVVVLPTPGELTVPRPPRALGAPGREAWRAAFASAAWLRTDADLILVRQWADAHDERHELRELIRAEGRVTKGSRGQQTESPYVGMLRAVEAQILRLAGVLGFGPQNQARLGVAIMKMAAEGPDKLDLLLERWGER